MQAAMIPFAIIVLLACRGDHGTSPTPEGQVRAVAPMAVSRAAHTATLLRNGKVLVAGGFGGGQSALASVELFSPEEGRFAAAGAMRVARSSHTATLLPDGRVLIAGGFDGGYLSSAELYDPVTGSFTATGAMTVARSDHIAVLLPNGKVLVAGGVGTGWTFLSSAELYDPATGRFAPTGSLSVPRESHTATLLRDGRVLITGGHQGRHAAITIYASAEVYDPANGRFTRVGDMRVRRHKHDAVALADGSVLVLGGSDERDERGQYRSAELFDPRSGSFSETGSMQAPRYKFNGASVLLADGSVLLMGGSAVTELYDPVRRTFATLSPGVGVARLFAAATRLPDGGVLLTGGYGTGVASSAGAWVFRP